LSGGVALVGRFPQPLPSLAGIPPHSFAFLVAGAKDLLGRWMTCFGRLPTPLDGLSVVLWHPLPFKISSRELELRGGVLLRRGPQEPLRGFRVILRYACSFEASDPHERLSDCVALFRVEGARLNGPIQFKVQENLASTMAAGSRDSDAKEAEDAKANKEHTEHRAHGRPLSMEARLLEALSAIPPLESGPTQETLEHLAYLKRWYYRTSKLGEAFFTDEKGELPMRRIVRGISRVFRGEKASDLRDVARDYWINRGKAAELNPEDYNV
jgi:hypothetical protein